MSLFVGSADAVNSKETDITSVSAAVGREDGTSVGISDSVVGASIGSSVGLGIGSAVGTAASAQVIAEQPSASAVETVV